MKLFRIWLLVLLAVLLPVRGAMAVAMACPPAGAPISSHTVAVTQDAAHPAHHDDGAAQEHSAMGHGHAGSHDGSQDHGKSHSDKCNLCSASCSATPLVRDVAGVPELNDPAATTFPSLSAPAPSFLSDGQERPPRSI